MGCACCGHVLLLLSCQHIPTVISSFLKRAGVCNRLPGPLTPAKRSREVRLGGSSQGGLGGASPPQKLKVESSSGAGQSSAAVPMPGDDLPPVIAPPGRLAPGYCLAASDHSIGITAPEVWLLA